MASRLDKLKEIAADLNAKLKLDPALDVEVDSAKALKAAIVKEMEAEGGQLYNEDQELLEEDTWEYLTDTLELEPKPAPTKSDDDKPTKAPGVQKKKEEAEMAKKKAKKEKGKKKAAVTKDAKPVKKKAPAAKKKKTEKKLSGPSNKEKVYKLWNAGKIKKPEKLHAKIDEAVQLSTISGWIKAWENGKNLPACATKK